MNKSDFGLKLKEIAALYESLPYEQQKAILQAISVLTKSPPYYLTFKLDPDGVYKMAKALSYCQKYSIPFSSEKLGTTRVRLKFTELSERNSVLIGRLTV